MDSEQREKERKGELLVVLGAITFGLFPVIVVFTYSTLSAFATLTWSTLFAAIFFSVVVVWRRRLHELRDSRVWRYAFFATLFNGIIFYGLYFYGLKYTTPGNAATIMLLQVLTTFMFFNVVRRENIPTSHKLGAVLMVFGAFIILVRDFSSINIGDLLIVAAPFFTPFGNYFLRQAREFAASETIMFLRSWISTLLFFFALYALHAAPPFMDVRTVLPFLILIGAASLGLEKILWIEGIHRIAVTKAMALSSSVTPLCALLFAWVLLGQAPTVWQLLSLPFLIAGALFLTDQLKLKRGNASQKRSFE